MEMHYVIYIVVAIGAIAFGRAPLYRKEYVEELCKGKEEATIKLERTGNNSNLILAASRTGYHSQNVSCTIKIERASMDTLFMGGLRMIEFNLDDCNNGETYLEITKTIQSHALGRLVVHRPERYCKNISEDFIEALATFQMKYVTAPKIESERLKGFTAIFTVYQEYYKKGCPDEDFRMDCFLEHSLIAFCASLDILCDGIENCHTKIDESQFFCAKVFGTSTAGGVDDDDDDDDDDVDDDAVVGVAPLPFEAKTGIMVILPVTVLNAMFFQM